MARKLKTFTTSVGFFGLADINEAGMKAALDAWDAGRNLFKDGFAKVSDDPAVVAATTARPGVVLRRAVGSNAPFSEQAALPRSLPAGKRRRPVKASTKAPTRRDKPQTENRPRTDERAQQKEEARRDRAIATAQAALDRAARAHKARIADLEKAWATLERRRESEEARWQKEKHKLAEAVRRARS